MSTPVPGFEIPFHGALAEPITIAGAPRAVVILIGTFTAVLSLGLQAPVIGLPLGALLYGAALWATKRDPYALQVLARHMRQRAHLDG